MMGAAVGFDPTADSAHFIQVLFGAWATVMLLQILSNYANDLGDAENGADGVDRTDRAVASGRIRAEAMRRAVYALAGASLLTGMATVGMALYGTGLVVPALVLIGLGIAGIGAAYKYTAGKHPYGYRGLGDLAVMAFFGWIGVSGTAFLVSGMWNWAWLLPGTFTGAMSVAVLNLNNMRDAERDAAAGKRTLVTRMGFERAKMYHAGLLIAGWAALFGFTLIVESGQWRGMMWIALIGLVHLRHLIFVAQNQDPLSLDGELKRMALSTAVVAFFLLLAAIQPHWS